MMSDPTFQQQAKRIETTLQQQVQDKKRIEFLQTNRLPVKRIGFLQTNPLLATIGESSRRH